MPAPRQCGLQSASLSSPTPPPTLTHPLPALLLRPTGLLALSQLTLPTPWSSCVKPDASPACGTTAQAKHSSVATRRPGRTAARIAVSDRRAGGRAASPSVQAALQGSEVASAGGFSGGTMHTHTLHPDWMSSRLTGASTSTSHKRSAGSQPTQATGPHARLQHVNDPGARVCTACGHAPVAARLSQSASAQQVGVGMCVRVSKLHQHTPRRCCTESCTEGSS